MPDELRKAFSAHKNKNRDGKRKKKENRSWTEMGHREGNEWAFNKTLLRRKEIKNTRRENLFETLRKRKKKQQTAKKMKLLWRWHKTWQMDAKPMTHCAGMSGERCSSHPMPGESLSNGIAPQRIVDYSVATQFSTSIAYHVHRMPLINYLNRR